jgi:anti-anti-sigma factor
MVEENTMGLEVTTETIGAATVVHLAGQLDTSTADDFDVRMRELLAVSGGGGLRLVLDLARVTYMSSAGLRSLSLVAKTTKTNGGALALAGIAPRVQEVLDIVRFTSLFLIAPTVEQAIALVQS